MAEPSYWVVIPAAGVGSRMRADRPKQYLELAGRTVIEHTIARFSSHPAIKGIVVVITDGDPYWAELNIDGLITAPGGAERCHSVLNGLDALDGLAGENDWVLVHDAARPCLRREDIDKLIAELSADPVGGLLGLPVADTLKRVGPGDRVEATVDRDRLWRALTPQMFRLGALRDALRQALADGFLVTDGASAMEHAGFAPRMVEGRGENIKITRPEDLSLAGLYIDAEASHPSALRHVGHRTIDVVK